MRWFESSRPCHFLLIQTPLYSRHFCRSHARTSSTLHGHQRPGLTLCSVNPTLFSYALAATSGGVRGGTKRFDPVDSNADARRSNDESS